MEISRIVPRTFKALANPREIGAMAGPEWRLSEGPIDYPTAIEEMELRVAAVRAGTLGEQVWLLEHPPLYTAGTSAKPSDLLGPSPFPVYKTGRGGQFTYHGPGQRVAYVMLDLKRRRPDVRCFVQGLEEWMILTLERFGVKAGRRDGRIGIWVPRNGSREDKIAAIGVRVRRWVTYHGVALNVAPDLNHFKGIVPCGIAEANFGVTSLHALGVPVKMAEVDAVLRETFGAVFEAEGAAMICQNPD